MFNDPVDKVEWLDAEKLIANDYNPNVCIGKEFKLLEFSILKNGWIQPILVNRNNIIIDGFHRWGLSNKSKALKDKYGGQIPCVVLDIGDAEAMMLTVRINRAKGAHIAIKLSEMVRRIIDEYGIPKEQVAVEIGAYKNEVDLLYSEGVFKAKDIPNHSYSPAWEPRKE